MKLRDNKGSITIFVLVGLLFMTSFLIISFGSNINKSKSAKEQFNIMSSVYSHNDGDEKAYMRAYTALRKKNAQILTQASENSSTLELTKTFTDTLSNYKIYGNSVQNGTPTPDTPVEIQSVGDKTVNLFNQSITETTSFADFSNTSVRSFKEGVWYLGLTLNNYSTPTRITSKTFNKTATTFTTTSNPYGLAQAFKCEPNQTYMFSCNRTNGNVGFGFYDAEGNFIKYVYWSEGYSNTTPENCYWMTVCFCGSDNTEATYSNAQLKLGNTATEYEPYGKYKITVKVSEKNYDKEKYTIVGTPTVTNDGIASNFSSTSYINTGYEFTPGNKTWEYHVKIKTGDTFGSEGGVVGAIGTSCGCTPFYMDPYGRWICWLSSVGSTWDIASGDQIMKLDTNTTYWLKAQFSGTQYVFSYSLNGIDWAEAKKIESSKTIYGGLTVHLGNNRGSNNPFKGEIDLSSFYIKINNEFVFTGGKGTTIGGHEKTANIYLNEPLRKIGDYADYIDFENQKVVRNIKSTILNGSEIWYMDMALTNSNRFYTTGNTIAKSLNNICLSNRFINSSKNSINSIDEQAVTIANDTQIVLRLNSKIVNSVELLKSWLGLNNIEVNHILETPDDTETIEIRELKSFEDYTKIEVLTEIAPSKIEATYYGYTME